MSAELQSQEAEANVGLPMPGPDIVAGAEQPLIPSATRLHEHVATSTLPDESDPIEVELAAKLDGLLAKDVELSAAYLALLQNYRRTGRERSRMRSELRRLHTEEGAILYQVKLHRIQKGRGGKWAQFLRERKPKALSRTTADRWIQWFLNSKPQEQSPKPHPEPPPKNAPQDERGAFSADAESQSASGDQQLTVTTNPPPMDDSKAFENPQQVILLLKESQAARFKAAAEFLADKIGSATHHQAIYVTVVEAAEKLGFVYPTTATEERNISDVSKAANPGNQTTTPRS